MFRNNNKCLQSAWLLPKKSENLLILKLQFKKEILCDATEETDTKGPKDTEDQRPDCHLRCFKSFQTCLRCNWVTHFIHFLDVFAKSVLFSGDLDFFKAIKSNNIIIY